jgi:c-di-GMP-binding flagellar brake protein YcgR
MNRTMHWALPEQELDQISGGRRRDKRYEIELDTQWKLIRRRKVLDSGSGRTVDLSSGGILIEADRPLPVGLNLEISIAWPVLLHNVAPLQLVVAGKIVRSKGKLVAVRMVQHEFRTVGAPGKQGAALPAEARTPLAFVTVAQHALSCPRPS